MLTGSLPFPPGGAWQWPRPPDHRVSEDARRLVGALLVHASDRVGPDQIVKYPFISNGSYLENVSPTHLIEAPVERRHGPLWDAKLFQCNCQLAGVGTDDNGNPWRCVGTKEGMNTLRDRKESIFDIGFRWG